MIFFIFTLGLVKAKLYLLKKKPGRRVNFLPGELQLIFDFG